MGKDIAENVFCILAVAEGNAVLIAEQLVRILREGDSEAKFAASDVLWDLAGYRHSVSVIRDLWCDSFAGRACERWVT